MQIGDRVRILNLEYIAPGLGVNPNGHIGEIVGKDRHFWKVLIDGCPRPGGWYEESLELLSSNSPTVWESLLQSPSR